MRAIINSDAIGGRDRLAAIKYADEAQAVRALLARQPLSGAERARMVADAARLVEGARAAAKKQGVVESFSSNSRAASGRAGR